MSTPGKDALFDLIKSLTKAEKRNFKIYVKKIPQSNDSLFLQLFEYLDKQASYDVNILLHDLKILKKEQVSNLKRHLYHHLLASLRSLNSKKKIRLQIREFIDYAEILYGKGFYLQSLKILNRAKKLAQSNHQDLLQLEIVEFEKLIESRHITRSSTGRMDTLREETYHLKTTIAHVSDLSNLKLYLQRLFINNGPLKKAEAKETVQHYFKKEIAIWEDAPKTFFEKVYYYQSWYWFHFLYQDYDLCFDFARKWSDLYETYPNMIEKDVDMYLRSIHHVLNTAFFCKKKTELDRQLRLFADFMDKGKQSFNPNTFIQAYLFLYQAQFNFLFLHKQFSEGLPLVKEVQHFINRYEYQLDNYKIMILYYKMACCCFGAGQYGATIDYLNKIINYQGLSLREDIIIYTRILLIMAHFEEGNYSILEYLINTLSRQVSRSKNPDQLPQTMVTFFRQLNKVLPQDQSKQYQLLLKGLRKLSTKKDERRAFIFLDMIPWAESKLEQPLI